MVGNIDSAWFDASGGRARCLSVIDTGTGDGCRAARAAAHRSGAPRAAALRSGRRLDAPTVSWSMAQAGWSRVAGGHDGVVLPSTAREHGTEGCSSSFRIRSGNPREISGICGHPILVFEATSTPKYSRFAG